MWRAAHQLFDSPRVLDDPLATRIVGERATRRIERARRLHGATMARSARGFMVARSRLAEDQLARAVGRGTAQCVVLGAGLDTFGYRSPYRDRGLRVFEVDHPATQAWKRDRLAEANIAIPESVTFAPVDFDRQTLADGLASAGFDRHAPAFFSWLGVTMYLTDDAFGATLAFIASMPPGGGVVFDYVVAAAALGWKARLLRYGLMRRVARAGEPMRSSFLPSELVARLSRGGFREVHDLGASELNARYFQDRVDGLRLTGGFGRIATAEV